MSPKFNFVKGTLVKLGRGFGFVKPLDGSEDVFIPGHSLGGALPNDVVRVEISPYPRREGSREGEIVSIEAYGSDAIIGVVRMENGRRVLIADIAPNVPFLIKRSASADVVEGDIAAAKIIRRAQRYDDIRVGIVKNFGASDSAAKCARAALFSAGITKSFADNVKMNAKNVAIAEITKEQLKTRVDLRAEPIFTIDSESTKDIDDAISAYKTGDGYKLCVHIADVSHYVKPNTALDEEAFKRGTSIYYANEVIPMLPKSISNGVCSLNEGEDRLAFTCTMILDNNGVMLDYRFEKSIIRSRVKGVYSEINTIFAGVPDRTLAAKYTYALKPLAVMKELYHKLEQLREERGSMDIESDETRLIVDENGCCVGAEKVERGQSECMIEEFMLMANTAAAHFARTKGVPFVYRTHEKPSAEKVEHLKMILDALGVKYSFAADIPTQKELSALLDKTRDTNLEVPVHTAVLRSMAKAVYTSAPVGHFGLALGDYAHFTSPIRRYPDLAIHRILSDVVGGMDTERIKKQYKTFAGKAAEVSTEKEQNAVKLARNCDDFYKAEYMSMHIGEEFNGIISSVTSFGIFISLENSIEGLAHISTLSQKEMQLVDGVCLTEGGNGRSFRMGDNVRVHVQAADIYSGRVDFTVVPAAG